jgi:hypothetical protein
VAELSVAASARIPGTRRSGFDVREVISMLVVSKHFRGDALQVLRKLPPDQACGEIPDAKGYFVCRGERAPEGFAFLAFLQEGEIVGVLCQKK